MIMKRTAFLFTTVVSWLQWVHAQSVSEVAMKMIEEERVMMEASADDYSDKSVFDFIVVGAGTAGCVVASRLSEVHHWRVLLLEAGEDETFVTRVPMMGTLSRPSMDWNYTTVPMAAGCILGPEGRCPYPRGKVMGGSTATNAMMYVRGGADVYDEWARKGNHGWDYNSILQYFKKSENMTIPELRNSSYHGTDGAIRISYVPYASRLTEIMFAAAKEKGIPEIDYNGARMEGVSRIQTTMWRGRRWSANRGYLYPARKRANLVVRKRSLVTRVLFQGTYKRANGVCYERDGRTHKAFATKEVILCAGAVNTPQLLMLSGVGPRKQLEDLGIKVISDLKVGESFMDHFMFLGHPIVVNTSIAPTSNEIYEDPQNYINYLINGTGPLTSFNGIEMLYYFNAKSFSTEYKTNMEMFFFNSPPAYGLTSKFRDFYSGTKKGEYLLIPTLLPLLPTSRGKITLASSNPHDQPNIFPNYLGEQQDVQNAVDAIKKMSKIFETNAFRKVGAKLYEKKVPGCEKYTFASDQYWECALKKLSATIYHACCSCPMGPAKEPSSVVTPELLVKGVRRLRVVDASVFPSITSGHLEAPTLAVAEKAADMIKKMQKLK